MAAARRKPKPRPSSRDGLSNVITGLGQEEYDKRKSLEYSAPVYTETTLRNIFRASWISKRICKVPAEDMTREWRTVSWSGSSGEDAQAVEREEERLSVAAKFKEAWIWARRDGGAKMVLWTKGAASREGMAQPLDATKVRRGDLLRLEVYDRWHCSPGQEIDLDENSPNCGEPLYWWVWGGSSAQRRVRVHWTRIISFDGELADRQTYIDNGRWHDSVLQTVFENVRDYDASNELVAAMMHDAVVDVWQMEGLAEMLARKDGETSLRNRIRTATFAKGVLKCFPLDAEDKYERKEMSFSGIDKVLASRRIDVCGAARMPDIVLFGQSPAGLTATGDVNYRLWLDSVMALQENDQSPRVRRLDQVLVRSALGRYPEDFAFEWKPLWQPSAKEASDIAKQDTDALVSLLNAKVLKPSQVAAVLLDRGTYPTLQQSDVDALKAEEDAAAKRAEEAAKQPPPPPGTPPGQQPGQEPPDPKQPQPPKAQGTEPPPAE